MKELLPYILPDNELLNKLNILKEVRKEFTEKVNGFLAIILDRVHDTEATARKSKHTKEAKENGILFNNEQLKDLLNEKLKSLIPNPKKDTIEDRVWLMYYSKC